MKILRFPASVLVVLAFALSSAAALAGPVGDFEKAFREAYGDYRAALFMTNTKDADAALKAQLSFEKKWSGIVSRWGKKPPPQYADDSAWPGMLDRVGKILSGARTAIKAGDLAKGHEILEEFRDEIGSLNARNNVATFSDRMNAYHAQMESVLGKTYGGFDAAGRAELAEDLAVLAFLAQDLERRRPADSRASAEFTSLLGALNSSVAAARKAAKAGDVAGLKQTVSGLKPPYSKFFLKFG